MCVQQNERRVKLPKYIEEICKYLAFYPAPYEYILAVNKHNPDAERSLESKTEKLRRYIMRHNGEFDVLSEDFFIKKDRKCIRLYFNCAVIYAQEIDELVKKNKEF